MAFRKENREFQLELLRVQIYYEQIISFFTILIAIEFSVLVSAIFDAARFLMVASVIMIVFTLSIFVILIMGAEKELRKLRQKYVEYF